MATLAVTDHGKRSGSTYLAQYYVVAWNSDKYSASWCHATCNWIKSLFRLHHFVMGTLVRMYKFKLAPPFSSWSPFQLQFHEQCESILLVLAILFIDIFAGSFVPVPSVETLPTVISLLIPFQNAFLCCHCYFCPHPCCLCRQPPGPGWWRWSTYFYLQIMPNWHSLIPSKADVHSFELTSPNRWHCQFHIVRLLICFRGIQTNLILFQPSRRPR